MRNEVSPRRLRFTCAKPWIDMTMPNGEKALYINTPFAGGRATESSVDTRLKVM